MHQCAELSIKALVGLIGQPQPRPGDVRRVDPHPTQVQMLQSILAQCLSEPLDGRLPVAIADQAGDFAGAPRQQGFDDVHADKTVGTGDDDLVYIAQTANG
ncbi:hypothetical protein D3C87_1420960 [compost metagenome]